MRDVTSRATFLRATIAGVALSAFNSGTAFAQSAPALKVRVAGIPLDVAATIYYAQDQGILAKHGLDVEIVPGMNAAAIAAAVVGGSIDIGSGNVSSLASAHERNIPFLIIAPSGAYSSKQPTGGLVIAKTSPVTSAHEFIGKTIGVNNLRAIGEVAMRAWLDKSGVPNDQVKFIEIPMPQLASAVSAGRIDAAILEEPFLSAFAAADGKVFANAYDAIAPIWDQGGYFCLRSYAAANQQTIKRLADAFAETALWANANPSKSLVILEAISKTTLPPNARRIYYPERLRSSQMQPLIDASAKYGVLQKAFPARDMFADNVGAT